MATPLILLLGKLNSNVGVQGQPELQSVSKEQQTSCYYKRCYSLETCYTIEAQQTSCYYKPHYSLETTCYTVEAPLT